MVFYEEDWKSKCCGKDILQKHGDKEYYCMECGEKTEAVRVVIRRDLGVY
jgi:predicted RNA-binding Zn-ribbon protein involved in translation (DUF1610 family)